MHVPLWFVVLVVAVLGIQLTRPPWWLVVLLLLGAAVGFLPSPCVSSSRTRWGGRPDDETT